MVSFSSAMLNPDDELKILDVGSLDINGCYKKSFQLPKWSYTGMDITPGKNVDLVVPDPHNWTNIQDKSYDVVVSGNCLEHIEAPWMVAKEIERITKDNGICIFTVPWNHGIHRFPVDCWRILPDGMTYMMTKFCNFKYFTCGVCNNDTYFFGSKTEIELTVKRPIKCHICYNETKTDGNLWYCLSCGEKFDNILKFNIRPSITKITDDELKQFNEIVSKRKYPPVNMCNVYKQIL